MRIGKYSELCAMDVTNLLLPCKIKACWIWQEKKSKKLTVLLLMYYLWDPIQSVNQSINQSDALFRPNMRLNVAANHKKRIGRRIYLNLIIFSWTQHRKLKYKLDRKWEVISHSKSIPKKNCKTFWHVRRKSLLGVVLLLIPCQHRLHSTSHMWNVFNCTLPIFHSFFLCDKERTYYKSKELIWILESDRSEYFMKTLHLGYPWFYQITARQCLFVWLH